MKLVENKMNDIKAIRLYILCALSCFTLFSCNEMKQGTIVNKFYEQPRYYTSVEYDVIFKMPMTKTKYDDGDYVFMVKNIIDSDTIIKRFEVNSETYRGFEVGDWIDFE